MKELIDEIMRRVPVQLRVGQVKSFDKAKGLCDISIEGSPDLLDVRTRSVADEQETGILVSPKKDSFVLVAIIDNKPESACIIGYSEIDEYYLVIEQSKFRMNKDGFLMGRGSNVMGSLVSDLIDAILQMTVTTGTGPSGTPINATVFSQIKQKFSQLLKTS